MKYSKLYIEKYRFIAENSLKINFGIDLESKKKLNFKSGQFINLKININNKEYIRQYSLVDAPHENKISVVIKKQKNGIVSNYIYNNINNIKFLEISNPTGNFTIKDKPNEKRTIIFFATGSGITPIFSLIKHILFIEKGTNIYLFYGNKTKKRTILYNEIKELNHNFKENFNPYFIFSQENCDILFKGRIDQKKVDLYVNQIFDIDEVDEVFICGNENMIVNVARKINDLGIPKENIHFEFFNKKTEHQVFNSTKIKYIETKINVNIIKNNIQKEIIWNPLKNSLLDEILKNNIDVPYSCKSGICGICECNVIKGKLEIENNETLTDKELSQNKSLVCVSKPLTNDIEINFDN